MTAGSARSYFSFAEKPGENAWLDLVRAIAIALVLMRHGYRVSADAYGGVAAPLDALFMNGWVGVDLFFVLSGYLISRHLLRHGIGSGRFVVTRYLALRALRIVPAYIAVIALTVAGAFPLYRFDHGVIGVSIGYHLLFLQDYLPANINIAFWSLGVEEKFYLIAPILMWAVLTRRRLAHGLLILLAVLAVSPALRAMTYAGSGPMEYEAFFRAMRSPFHASLEPLMIGVMIAAAQHAGRIEFSPRFGAAIFATAAAALVVFLSSHDFMARIGWFDVSLQPILLAVLFGLMVLGATRMKAIPLAGGVWVRTVARLSYCLYLVHFPLLPLSAAIAAGSAYPPGAFWILFLTLSFALAALLHFAVEKPFLITKDKLAAEPPRAFRPVR